jgi:BASS family bile acid:Na+ symporter
MRELLRGLLQIVIPAYAISSMASLGLAYDFLHVTNPLRRPVMVLTALLANFVIVPLLALVLMRALGLEQAHGIGLFLISNAAGAPFLLKLVQAARGDMALAGGLLILLLPASILYLPLVLPLALPRAEVDVGEIAATLVMTMLLPLAAGFVVHRRSEKWAKRMAPVLGKLSTLLLAALIAATLVTNIRGIASLAGTPAIAAAALLTMGGLAAGYAVGVPSRESRVVLGLGTGQRNIAAAMIVASSGFGSAEPLVMVVVSSLVAFAILFPAACLLRRGWTRRAGSRAARFRPARARAREVRA